MIRTVLILFFIWSSLSIGRSLISLGETTEIRENVPELNLSPSSTTGFAGSQKLDRAPLSLMSLLGVAETTAPQPQGSQQP